jgi:hypothetical protein
MMPGFTSLSDASTILATIGIAPTVRGTIDATVPIEDPTTNLVNGIKSTSKMRNGSERVTFTIKPTTPFTTLFSRSLPFDVEYSTTPSGMPTAYENKEAKNVMMKVSHTPVMIASFI